MKYPPESLKEDLQAVFRKTLPPRLAEEMIGEIEGNWEQVVFYIGIAFKMDPEVVKHLIPMEGNELSPLFDFDESTLEMISSLVHCDPVKMTKAELNFVCYVFEFLLACMGPRTVSQSMGFENYWGVVNSADGNVEKKRKRCEMAKKLYKAKGLQAEVRGYLCSKEMEKGS